MLIVDCLFLGLREVLMLRYVQKRTAIAAVKISLLLLVDYSTCDVLTQRTKPRVTHAFSTGAAPGDAARQTAAGNRNVPLSANQDRRPL